MIGCTCDVCTSDDPRDHRTRSSIFVRSGAKRFLIDTGPELRLQCIANGVDAVDAILFTHHHADHVAGLDDVRRFNWLMKKPVHCYGSAKTLDSLRGMFAYAFMASPGSPHSRPHIDLHEIGHDSFDIEGESIQPIPLIHGSMPVLGFRFSNFAYCTDCSEIPDTSMALLEGLDVLVIDALRRQPHPAHFNLEGAIEISSRIKAKRTYFTHIAHELKHADVNEELPTGMALAYDGLRISST
ncbi:MAG: MBL fold metallo-hydrolase [Phycisphaerae bacterium]